MSKNMTILDRRLRAFLVVPVAIAAGIVVGPASVGSIVLYAVAAVMLVTSAAGYCPWYFLVGLAGHGRHTASG
jgi:hypothetical protein